MLTVFHPTLWIFKQKRHYLQSSQCKDLLFPELDFDRLQPPTPSNKLYSFEQTYSTEKKKKKKTMRWFSPENKCCQQTNLSQ